MREVLKHMKLIRPIDILGGLALVGMLYIFAICLWAVL